MCKHLSFSLILSHLLCRKFVVLTAIEFNIVSICGISPARRITKSSTFAEHINVHNVRSFAAAAIHMLCVYSFFLFSMQHIDSIRMFFRLTRALGAVIYAVFLCRSDASVLLASRKNSSTVLPFPTCVVFVR